MINFNKCLILDIGLGNLKSIENKLNKEGFRTKISDQIEDIENTEIIIISGVGNFYQAMKNIKEKKLIKVLNEKIKNENCKILGICLGMQLFTNFSEEGNIKGLGLFDAETVKINYKNIKVPNINWMKLDIKKNFNLFDQNNYDKKFYFCHSYHVKCKNSEDVISTSKLNNFEFVSAIRKNNVLGVQFHIEKSYEQGMEIIKNFINE